MALPIIVAGAIAVSLLANAAFDYLFPDDELPEVGPTTPTPSAPFTPPFLGGQCVGVNYSLVFLRTGGGSSAFIATAANGGQGAAWSSQALALQNVSGNGFPGPISSFTNTFASSTSRTLSVGIGGGGFTSFNVPSDSGFVFGGISNEPYTYSFVGAFPRNGSADACGNIPDPNPPPPIPDGGVPQNGTPALGPDDQLIEAGAPLVLTPSVLGALATLAAAIGQALASAQAAADALAATKALADAVGKVAEALDAHKETFDELRKYLNKKKREDAANKQIFIRQFGSIVGDGYLDITPRPAPEGFKPLMLDFLCFNIPGAHGRFFGLNSYNWFRYEELGSICFLSPTSGVLSIHKIEHVRTSIPIPELAIGFTYNMGLNRVKRARVSMLYTQEKT